MPLTNASHRHTVLIVEDDDDNREALAELLTLQNVEVRPVSGAEEALALLRDGVAPCVVLLDYRMQGLDGADFLAAWPAEVPRLPVLLVTGDIEAASRARELGVEDMLLKPVEPSVLRGMIERHCRTR